MKNPVSERLTAIISYFAGGNEKRFAEAIGVKPAVINNYTNGKQQSKPGFEVLHKMVEAYPDLQIDWLVSGKGAMLRSENSQPSLGVLTQDLRGNATVPIINRKAAANYLTGFQTQEFFEQLDALQLPSAFVRGRQFYALQVSGDSMEPTLHDGDLVICYLCDRSDWDLLRNGDVCVVVSESRGLQVKRIKMGDGTLTCLSDNRLHPAFQLPHDDIRQLWKVNWKLSAYLEEESSMTSERILSLEERLQKLERRNIQ
jgi:phage repressor protein C with HTH and peptisase S24 domain